MAIQQVTHDPLQQGPVGSYTTPNSAPAPQPAPEARAYRGSIVLPLLLVGMGVLFLLNNLEIVGWDVWASIWQLWPLLLVAVGIDLIIGRRTPVASVLTTVALFGLIAVVATGIWFWSAQQTGWQSITTQQITQTLSGATQADVEISFGAGTLRMSAADSSDLIGGTTQLNKGERADTSFRVSSGTAYYTLKSETSGLFVPFFNPEGREKTWNLNLNSQIPTDLSISTGVGEAFLQLGDLNLTRLEVNAGVGSTNIALPGRGDFDVRVNAGVGEVNIEIPKGFAARIEVTEGLGDIRVQGDYERQGSIYESPTYNSAESKVDLKVEGGIGQITIREGAED